MRGTVLLLDTEDSLAADVDLFRANGLMVHGSGHLAGAVQQIQQSAPDVIIVRAAHDMRSIVAELRRLANHDVSIIVVARPEEGDAARAAGADSFVPASAAPADLLYEIHRALILRRSGRRLPWNR